MVYFHLKSLANGIFFTKIHKNWRGGAKLSSVFGNFSYQGNIWAKIPESTQEWAHDQEMVLSHGMFSTEVSLAKGIWAKTGANFAE